MKVSPSAWALAAIGLIGSVVGLVWAYPSALVVGVGALALVALGVVAARSPIHLEIDRLVSGRMAAVGDAVTVRLVASNPSASTSRSLLGEELTSFGPQRVTIGDVRSGESVHAGYDVHMNVRGRHHIGPLRLVRTDGLRLVESSRVYGDVTEIVVHAPVSGLSVAAIGSRRSDDGSIDGRPRETGSSFFQLRDYVSGDDPRRVHWRSVAKTGNLVVRQYVDPMEPEHVVIFDRSDGDGFESAVAFATSVMVAIVNAMGSVRLLDQHGHLLGRFKRRDEILRWSADIAADDGGPAIPPGSGGMGTNLGSIDGAEGRVNVDVARVAAALTTINASSVIVVSGRSDPTAWVRLAKVCAMTERVWAVRIGPEVREPVTQALGASGVRFVDEAALDAAIERWNGAVR